MPSAFASAAGLPLSSREGEAYAVPALGLKAHAAVALLPAGGNAPDGWMLQAGACCLHCLLHLEVQILKI